jgi:alkylhydroperoxidase family enzyme
MTKTMRPSEDLINDLVSSPECSPLRKEDAVTWLVDVDRSRDEVDAVFGLLPDVYDRLRTVLDLAWSINDSDLMQTCRLLIVQMHGTRLIDADAYARQLAELEDWRSSAIFSARERVALDYAEQFVMDQNSLSDAQKQELGRHFSDRQVVAFVQGLNINDAYLRVLTLLDIPFDPEYGRPGAQANGRAAPSGGDDAASAPANHNGVLVSLTDPDYFNARIEHSRSAMRHTRVDDVTSELVRLRNANHQKCEFCMSVRRAAVFPSRPDAADPLQAVRMYESSGLPDHQKVALRLADAFLAYPKGFGPEQRSETLAQYDSEQIAEILLKLMCWSQNRTPIALGMDAPVDENELTAFDYDAAGGFALLGA